MAPSPAPRASSPSRLENRSSSGIGHGEFTPGTLIAARYRVVGLLGRGGMGEVYRVDDLTLAQPVALKFLHGDEGDDAAVVRLRDETRMARQVSHPNVCRVHDVGEWNGRTFVSMEYVDGEDLASLLRRIGRLSPDKAVDIIRQVCAGLAAAHERGVLHRDLKPANVMLDGRGKARITDFGLASVAGVDQAGQIAGTPAYMAPEQLAGGALSPQTDLYAVGLLLFELLTGRAAFHEVDFSERRRHPSQAPALPGSVRAVLDPQIVDVLDHCLAALPAGRPSSALALSVALPGGDPLAAALAAGETPAPHIVAAAADTDALSAGGAVTLLGLFAAGVLALLAVFGPSSYASYVAFPYSPEVLAVRAAEIHERLGYDEVPVDSAHGFITSAGYFGWRRAQSPAPPDWTHLQKVRPQPVCFWQRTSPHPLLMPVVSQFGIATATLAARSPEAVGPIDGLAPPPGESYLELGPDGALNAFVMAHPPDAVPAADHRPFDWSRLFAEARLDATAFVAADAEPVIPVTADARAAWTGAAPDGSGVPLRIEAAALRGRPVYFRIIAPWTATAAPPALPVESVLFTLLFFVLAIVGAILARYNLQQGRTDQRGAVRMAVTVGTAVLLAQMLRAHHVLSAAEASLVLGAVVWALFVAAFSWLSYVALEPYVRKHWPHALISWTRLVALRWRDRRVGRDLLIGTLFGLAGAFLDLGGTMLAGARVGVEPVWRLDLATLASPSGAFATFLHALAVATAFPLDMLFLLLLMRVFLPRPWMAPFVVVPILVGLNFAAFPNPILQLPFVVVGASLPIIALTRYGLLAGSAEMFVEIMSTSVLAPLDLSPFFARTLVIGVVLLAAPALIGFYAAMSGRSLVTRRFEVREGVS